MNRALDVVLLRHILELAPRATNLLWMEIRSPSASVSTLLSRKGPS